MNLIIKDDAMMRKAENEPSRANKNQEISRVAMDTPDNERYAHALLQTNPSATLKKYRKISQQTSQYLPRSEKFHIDLNGSLIIFRVLQQNFSKK